MIRYWMIAQSRTHQLIGDYRNANKLKTAKKVAASLLNKFPEAVEVIIFGGRNGLCETINVVERKAIKSK